MLGEKLTETRGNITNQRVLEVESAPKMETSFQEAGKIFGAEFANVGTFTGVFRPSGTLYGEGHGVLTTKDGDLATWKAQGVGTPVGRGNAASWRGSLCFHTQSEKLARLNTTAVIFEYEIDEENNARGKYWEWK
ncbi:MAG: hypothetical protein ACE5IB_05555 [Candidatus Geothermarchaeales archaeon]